jgi:hypothetical protein
MPAAGLSTPGQQLVELLGGVIGDPDKHISSFDMVFHPQAVWA